MPLLRLLRRRRLPNRRREHPDSGKGQPAGDGHADAGDPRPGARDGVRAWPLVVGHVADRHRLLVLEVRQEGPLVVDLEVEDAVLVGQGEGRRVRRRLLAGLLGRRRQRQPVEGREHAEFELQGVRGRGDGEGGPLVPGVLG